MLNFPPICYVYCYEKKYEDDSYERLKVSINSIPENLVVFIISWHKSLEKKLKNDFPSRKISIINKKYMKFSKSYFINEIANFAFKNNHEYIYLSDVDLFFHPEYFYWLKFIMNKLEYKNSDIRIITTNYNVRAKSKIKFFPRRLYGKISYHFPKYFDWTIPKSLGEILSREFSKSDYAHGCGLIPLKALRKIGGYNSEMLGHGPEDDLFNQRIKYYSRIYYHKGTYRSSTFHLPHCYLNQKDRLKNYKYWFNTIDEMNYNGIYSELIKRK